MYLSTTRLPLDHVISGALLGAISSASINYKSDKKAIAKSALKGGIAGGFSILAANQIVRREYAKAIFSAAIGTGALIFAEQILSNEKVENQNFMGFAPNANTTFDPNASYCSNFPRSYGANLVANANATTNANSNSNQNFTNFGANFNGYANQGTNGSFFSKMRTNEFLTGALLGAAAAYILTNKTAQEAILQGFVKMGNLFSAGIEELKERYEDAKASAEQN